jgi:hypothetical protein
LLLVLGEIARSFLNSGTTAEVFLFVVLPGAYCIWLVIRLHHRIHFVYPVVYVGLSLMNRGSRVRARLALLVLFLVLFLSSLQNKSFWRDSNRGLFDDSPAPCQLS